MTSKNKETPKTSKRCNKCNTILSISSFYKDSTKVNNVSSLCKLCTKENVNKYRVKNQEEINRKKREYQREHYKANKEVTRARHVKWKKDNPDHALKYKLKKHYKMTLEDYDNMLKSQDGKCKICKIGKCTVNNRLSVDHCHDTGLVRGLLCNACNSGVGYFKNNIENLKEAIMYLKNAESKISKTTTIIDVPSGHRYGFPCEMPEDMDLRALLKRKGYPEKDIDFALKYCRMWIEEVEL